MEASTYKYEEIVNDLSAAIQEGQYAPETLLPSEAALCRDYATSLITVRRAMAELRNRNLIYSIPGKGSFVKGPTGNFFRVDYKAGLFVSGGYDESHLISSRVIRPDAELVYRLSVTPQTRIVALKWLVSAQGIPVAIDEKYLPYSSRINLAQDEQAVPDFFTLLQKQLPPYSIRQEVRIDMARADEEHAGRLHIPEGASLWLFDIMYYDDERKPLGWNRQLILPDRCRLRAERS